MRRVQIFLLTYYDILTYAINHVYVVGVNAVFYIVSVPFCTLFAKL